jgi:hypothetical protein
MLISSLFPAWQGTKLGRPLGLAQVPDYVAGLRTVHPDAAFCKETGALGNSAKPARATIRSNPPVGFFQRKKAIPSSSLGRGSRGHSELPVG